MIFFSIGYCYVSILDNDETIRTEINPFARLLNSIREKLTDKENSQIIKVDLQKISAWFIIDYFHYIFDLMKQSKEEFRANCDEDTILADETDYA